MVYYKYGIYENQPLLFAELNLSESQRYKLIEYLEGDAYYNTGQDTEDYAFEFVIVVRNLCNSCLVLNPVFLAIDECFDDLKLILADQWNTYYIDYCSISKPNN